MWIMYATLFTAFQAFIVMKDVDLPISITAPTNLVITKEFKTQIECEDALKAMVRHLKAVGGCKFDPDEKGN